MNLLLSISWKKTDGPISKGQESRSLMWKISITRKISITKEKIHYSLYAQTGQMPGMIPGESDILRFQDTSDGKIRKSELSHVSCLRRSQ